jgi:hypothetical protein
MRRYVRKSKLSVAIPRSVRGVSTVLVSLLLTAALTGCENSSRALHGSASGEVVVRVGNDAISRAEVDHWASAIKRGSAVGTALGQTSGTPRQRALEFLISSSWIVREVEAQGLSISKAAIQHGLRERIDALPNGRSEFDEELSSTGQTLADAKLEARSALAVTRLRGAVAKRVPTVTDAEVRGYYVRHRQRFYLPNRRLAYLVEGTHSYAEALALARRVRPGSRLTRPWFRELVLETPEAKDRSKLVHMIFAASPGRVAGPKMFFRRWVLAVVKKLIPAGIQPLAVVRGELSKSLAVKREELTLRRFAAAYVRKWTASTSCSAGYVVQKCSEYAGALAQDNPLTHG